MLVTFCIVALNSEKTIGYLLNNLVEQTFDHSNIEVLLIDSLSCDSTKNIMQNFKNQNAGYFYDICIYDNPGKTLPCGWNVALKNYHGDVILRVDAHATIPTDFIEKNVATINLGHDIVGGKVESFSHYDSKWSEVVNCAENSMFGGSVAKFRRAENSGEVSTLAFAMYKREVFDKTGFYNEKLARTEDNEMHYRMKRQGYKFFYNPEIHSKRETRMSFRKLMKQKYLNGYWIGKTAKTCPQCFSIYHYIPFVFILGILITTLLSFLGIPLFSLIMWSLYAALTLLMTLVSFITSKKKNFLFVFLPVMFMLLHIVYGSGTFVGLIIFRQKK